MANSKSRSIIVIRRALCLLLGCLTTSCVNPRYVASDGLFLVPETGPIVIEVISPPSLEIWVHGPLIKTGKPNREGVQCEKRSSHPGKKFKQTVVADGTFRFRAKIGAIVPGNDDCESRVRNLNIRARHKGANTLGQPLFLIGQTQTGGLATVPMPDQITAKCSTISVSQNKIINEMTSDFDGSNPAYEEKKETVTRSELECVVDGFQQNQILIFAVPEKPIKLIVEYGG